MCRAPVDQIDDRSVERGAVECLARRGGVQPHPKLGAGFGVEDEPAFLLAAWIACRRCGFVVRMDLNRQTLGREEEFEDRKRTRLKYSHYCADRMPSSACKKRNKTTITPR